MRVPDVRSVLSSTEGLLRRPEGPVDPLALDRPVTGVEVYERGSGASYVGKLVVVVDTVDQPARIESAVRECRDAAALIFPPETSVAQHEGAPPILVRSSWAAASALIRALVELTRDAEAPTGGAGTALERDTALAVHRLESALLALLGGTADAATPAAIVGLRPDLDHLVIAADLGDVPSEQYRLALAAEFPDERSVLSDRMLFSVLRADGADSSVRVAEQLRARLGRAIRTTRDLPVGVGPVVSGVFTLHESAAAAREIVRAMRIKLGAPPLSADGGARVAGADDVPDALALIRAADALRSQGPNLAAPLMRIAEYDRVHGSDLLPSVLVSLEHRGNVTAAAGRLGIHANSLRARLKRVREISGVDLDEPVSTLRATVAFLAFPDAHNTARRSR